MKIELKKNNAPTKPGRYAWQEFERRTPVVSKVESEGFDGTLHVLMPPSLWYPVADMNPNTLWSEEIVFVLP